MKRSHYAIDKLGRLGATVIFATVLPAVASAQLVVSEDFTGTTINNSWTAINGACLTAGAASNGSIPGCVDLRYYITNGDAYQVGGQFGYLGGNTAPSSNAAEIPDAVSNGALRLTNGLPNYHESGAIVSTQPFDSSSGVQITFKTITYQGNSGGSGGDGADGISFFLLDASQYAAGSGLPQRLLTPPPPHVYGDGQLPLLHWPPHPSDAPQAFPEQLAVQVQFCWQEPLFGPHWL